MSNAIKQPLFTTARLSNQVLSTQSITGENIVLINNKVRIEQYKEGRRAAALGIPDAVINLRLAYGKDTTQLKVCIFPAKVLGRTARTFQEFQIGVTVHTQLMSKTIEWQRIRWWNWIPSRIKMI